MPRNKKTKGGWERLAVVSALLLALSACSGATEGADDPPDDDGETTEEATGDGLAGGDRSLKIGHPSEISLYDVVALITADRLNAEGWNIESVEFARTGLNPQALAQGTVQLSIIIGVESLRTFQAGGDDPNIRYVMDNNGGEFVIIAKADYPSCEDFDGIRFGIHGETSSTSVAAMEYVTEECGADPEFIVVPGGDNRIVALENDQLDATLVQYSDLFELQKVSDEGDYVVVDAGDALDFNGANWWINMDWYEANPEVATAYVAEHLRTCQMVRSDPSILRDAALEHTETTTEDTVDAAVETYLDPDQVNMCPENGGDLTMLQQIIDYNVEIDEIDPMDAEDAAHPTLKQDALDYLADNP